MTNSSGTNLNSRAAAGPKGEGMDSPSNFPRYPEYRPSGVEWLGELPTHWGVAGLGYQLADRPCYGVLVPDFDPDGVPMLRITDVNNGNADREALTKISEQLSGQYSRTIVEEGDVVLSVVGTIGECVVVDEALAGVNLSRALSRIVPNEKVAASWLRWLFQSSPFSQYVDLTCVGSAQRVLNMDDLRTFRVPVLARIEQTTIAAFLDRETAKIDALVAEQEKLIALLKEKRQAVISHAVTKGLNPDAPMKPSGIEWLGDVPAHWEITPLKWLTDPDRPIMYGIVLPGPDVGEGIPILKGGNVKPERMNLESMARTTPEIEAPYARARLKAGDLVYSIRGSIGDCEPVPAELERSNITQDVARVAIAEGICANWVRWALLASAVREELASGSLGAAVRGVNIFDLKRVKLPTPPYAEQAEIAKHIGSVIQRLRELIDEASDAITLLKERRSALISAAVTGQIDVRGAVEAQTA